MAEKLKMQSSDVIGENISFIESRWPSVVKEVRNEDGKLIKSIDFDVLKQELSREVISDKQERYQMTWPDKKKAILAANSSINGTLRPIIDKSVSFDNTKNLYIEGDNLDTLKLIRETYLKKVKMIYIDPPYNTGNDFVYNDDFAMQSNDYLERSGQYDEQGNRLFSNNESNGRFHSDWLNMIYPRLKVAKDLLSDDGILFVSIDFHEYKNLISILNELFGEKNCITTFVWEKGKEGGNDSSIMRSHYEFIACYCKNCETPNIINLDEKDTSRHVLYDKENNLVSGIESNPNEGELYQYINLSKQKDYTVKIPLIDGSVIEWPSYAPQSSIDKWIKIGKVFVGEKRVPYIKSYLKDELQGQKPSNIITQEYGTTKAGSIEIREYFGNREIFSYPKPSILLKRLISIGSKKDSIILDFFSGSASLADAVMQKNAEDGGCRKFILVQLPENCDEKSEAKKAGYNSICEIGEERIRRAGKKIKEENPLMTQDLDVGFRVLKLDSSNMKDVYYNPKLINQDGLFASVDNVKEDRTSLDLLFQVMLELGIELSAKITEMEIDTKQIFVINDSYLVACFASEITENVIRECAKINPVYTVFRDNSFANDSDNINCEQIIKTISPSTELKVI